MPVNNKTSYISVIRHLQLTVFIKNTNIDQVLKAINYFETEIIELNVLQQLTMLKPLACEVKIKKATNFSEKPDGPEILLLRVMNISNYSKKLDLLVLYANFEEIFDMNTKNIADIIGLCQFLTEKDDLKQLFSVISTCLMTVRGQKEDVFSALWQLKGIKSKDKKISLLEYIVKSYIDMIRKQPSDSKKVCSPMPEASLIKKASTIDLNAIQSHIEKLKENIDSKTYNSKLIFNRKQDK